MCVCVWKGVSVVGGKVPGIAGGICSVEVLRNGLSHVQSEKDIEA